MALQKHFGWETNKMPYLSNVSKMMTDEEDIGIYGHSYDFIDATLTELKRFNNSELNESIENINNTLKKRH